MPGSVHALAGPDLFLQLEGLRRIVHEAGTDVERIDFDGESAELAEVLDEVRSVSMFGTTRLVVVRNADPFVSNHRQRLEDFIADFKGPGILVLRMNSLPKNQRIYKLILKAGAVAECNPPKDASSWALTRARHYRLNLPAESARLLVELVGNDLSRLDNELAKLSLELADQPADPQAVRRSVSFAREQEMWEMTNELQAGNAPAALRRWRNLTRLDSSAEFRGITWLLIWLEKVIKSLEMRRGGASPAAIAGSLKIWPQAGVGPFLRVAERIGRDGAWRLVDRLCEIDHRSKTGGGQMAANVERFIAEAATLLGEYSQEARA